MNNPAMEDIFQQYESQYVTDLDGRLIRIEAATQEDLTRTMTLVIDGMEIGGIPKAVPTTDDQGNIVRDEDGQIKPRLSTVYDAVTWRYRNNAQANFKNGPDPKNPVPVLCHQNHLKPLGVCRVCSCLTVKKGTVGEKMIPACQHPLVDGMEVHTVASLVPIKPPGEKDPIEAGRYLRRTVRVLLELLVVNCLHEDQPPENRRYRNELLDLCRIFNIPFETQAGGQITLQSSYNRRIHNRNATDDSSAVIRVDHNNCILCDRCVRGCSEVKPFKIIGHTGFGNKAKISFDLGVPMGESGCVSCGECAVSCPTGALTFKTTIYKTTLGEHSTAKERDPWENESPKPVSVTADTLAKHPLFSGVPFSFLYWTEGSVGELKDLPVGTILCRQGEYGSTAFLIERGIIEVVVGENTVVRRMNEEDRLVGEGAIISHQPRGATLRVGEPGTHVLVIKRNILHMLQRNRVARATLMPAYRKRSLESVLRRGIPFARISPEQNILCSEYLTAREDVDFVQVDPGCAVFLQGNRADQFYVIARGHVTVQENRPNGHTVTINYLGRGQSFGEIGLLSEISANVARHLPPGMKGRRTFSCVALDHVELVAIPKAAFYALLEVGDLLVNRREDVARLVLAILEEMAQVHVEAATAGVPLAVLEKGARAVAWGRAIQLGEQMNLDKVVTRALGRTAFKIAEEVQAAVRQKGEHCRSKEMDERVCRLLDGMGEGGIQSIREALVASTIEMLLTGERMRIDVSLHQMTEFTRTGLYQGKKLLVLDLNHCTRCQECVKACADSHQGVTRLVLDGSRFDRYLVPSACRNCHDPACLVGCPVDAIHRRPAPLQNGALSQAIYIEQHCIGCSLCERNCPYGSIHMLKKKNAPPAAWIFQEGQAQAATNCDLCETVGGDPECVKRCPHEAAFRMEGIHLARLVGLSPTGEARK